MTAVFCIIAVVALISVYDYLSSRSWQLVTSDVRNNVVFENRNKKYGAFMIRQDYNRNMLVIMTSVLFGSGILFAAYKSFSGVDNMVIELPDTPFENDVIIPLDPIVEPELPELVKPKTQSAEAMVENLPPQIVDQKVKSDQKTQDELAQQKAGGATQTKIGDGIGTTITKPEPVLPPVVNIIPTGPVETPDVNAEYPGGFPAMAKFIQDNLRIPEVFIENGSSSKVYLRFVVGADGEISSVKVMRGVAGFPECEKAAMKVVKAMPKWKPGKVKGENVSTFFDLPINFQID